MRIKTGLFLCGFMGIISGITGCLDKAPHDNPLDPENNPGYSISGAVLTFYQPRKPIPHALIELQPLNLVTVCDDQGRFEFNRLESDTFLIRCSANGYSPDSVKVILKRSQQVEFLLDGLPRFENIRITAHKRSHWFPLEPDYFLDVEAEISDPDGVNDIQTVLCRIPEAAFTDTLLPTLEAGRFFSRMMASDMPVQSVHALIGKEIEFEARDNFGKSSFSRPHYITRIIEFTPILKAPIDYPTIKGDTLSFSWEPVYLPYSFSFSIEISRISLGIPVKIEEIEEINSGQTAYIYENTLNAGDYFWVLKIVDEFGNTSASKEGSFRKE